MCEGAEEEPEAAAAHAGRGQRWLPNGEKTRPKFLFGLSDESIKPLFGLDLLVEGFIVEPQKSSPWYRVVGFFFPWVRFYLVACNVSYIRVICCTA